ncbi:MAG: DJ-1/PfpI family protein [Actinobacteria bacterium]|nr:MAG: DJ-1/PfpI family protein [Actinomycetota bacterium]
MTRIAIALFEGAEELDWAGPWEVLAAWAQQWPDDGVDVFTVARTNDAVTCAKGLRVLPDRTWDDAGAVDVLVYPGGMGTRRELHDDDVLAWLRNVRTSGTLMTSVCTGALVYAAAGFLSGRPATTYWSALPLLAELDPTIELRPDDRFVDSGVRRYIQYDPEPPV